MASDQESEQSLRLLQVLVRAYRSVAEHSFRSSKENGFNPTEFAVLELLYHTGPQPLQAIGSRLLLVSGGVTYVVDKLEKNGLIYRKPCEKDRRVIFATLTEEGKKRMEAIYPEYTERISNVLAGVNWEEKEQLIYLLKKMGLQAEEKLNKVK